MDPTVVSSVRELRQRAGLSQSRLGSLVGVTRQSLAAIESERAVPSTEVALRIARALGVEVGALFRLADASPDEEWVEDSELSSVASGRMRTARIGGRTVGYPVVLDGGAGGACADGIGERTKPGEIRLTPFEDRPPPPDLVVIGCDPAFALARDRLRREHGFEVLWLRAGSRAALDALERQVAHVAGVHMRDPDSGVYNGPWIRRSVTVPTTRVAFATWQQVLLLGYGNPFGIEGLQDLARSEVRFVNREPGSGSRALVEDVLRERGIEGHAIPGFQNTAADGHETVARTVASGIADAGVAIRAVGHELGLPMIPLVEEPYELVIPDHFLELPAVEALLRELRTPALRRQVEALAGYDTSLMGRPA